MKLHFENHVVAGLFLTVSVLIFLAWYSFTSMERLIQTARMLSHSTRVINNAEQLMKASVDIETGQRGFVITGDEFFLEPSNEAKRILPARLSTLDSLTASSPSQKKRIKELHMLINTQLVRTEKVIDARTKSFEMARELVASGEGKRTSDAIRKLIAEIQDDERATFRKNNTVTAKSLKQFQSSFIGLVITVTGILIYLFYCLNKSLGVQKQVELKLQKTAQETRELYDNAPCGYLSVDASIYVSNMNSTLLGWLGYRQEEVIGKMKYEDLLSPESRQKFLISFQEDFDKYKTKGFVSDLEFEFMRKDGTTFPVVVNSSAVFDEAGEFENSITTVFDNTVRKKSEEQIAYLARLVEDSSEAVYSVSTDFHIRSWNKGAETLYGFTADEAIGKPVFEVVRSRMSEETRLSIRKQILSTGQWEGELEHIRKDDTTIYVLASATATRNKANEIQGYVSVCRDITDRKKAEEALSKLNAELEDRVMQRSRELVKSEAFNRGIINALSAHVAVIDATGKIIAVNKAWEEFARENGETAFKRTGIGSNYYDVCDKSAREGDSTATIAKEGIISVINGKDLLYEHEYPCHSPTTQRWFSMRVTSFNHGQPVGVIAHEDITHRKKTEEQLKASEARLINAQEVAKVGSWETNLLDLSVLWSDETYRIFELNPDDFESSHPNFLNFVHPEDRIKVEEAFMNSFKSRRINTIQHRIITPNNQVKHVEETWRVLHNEKDVPIQAVGTCQDITESKKIEEEIILLNESLEKKVEERTNQLKAVNKELEAFSYSVSHDLRAPLRSIAGYSQILKEDYSKKLDDEGQRITEVIIKNAKRMGLLIDDLLDFTKLGRKEMMKRKVNMPGVIADVLSELTVNGNGRKLSIKNLVQLSTEADAAMIHHVWTNLISNALKYSSKKEFSEIEIGSFEEFDSICYYVKDNGAGFDMLYVNKLFGVFQRLHKMNEFEGTGVGLAIVKTIVERHGGKVWAVGKLNEGATFYFSLPKGQGENLTVDK